MELMGSPHIAETQQQLIKGLLQHSCVTNVPACIPTSGATKATETTEATDAIDASGQNCFRPWCKLLGCKQFLVRRYVMSMIGF
jgi:hypothetical protein